MPREHSILKCTVCGEEVYLVDRNKKKHAERMEKEKYCPKCRKKTLFKEKK
ncbi:MAG: 50S ribosomal protein L33 [Erysipelotrichaceae bacterium]|jgi:large subunit ribosomal protein L33|nr:50S ribosomal protein L33 [Erysipelotrichaceae bacterium]